MQSNVRSVPAGQRGSYYTYTCLFNKIISSTHLRFIHDCYNLFYNLLNMVVSPQNPNFKQITQGSLYEAYVHAPARHRPVFSSTISHWLYQFVWFSSGSPYIYYIILVVLTNTILRIVNDTVTTNPHSQQLCKGIFLFSSSLVDQLSTDRLILFYQHQNVIYCRVLGCIICKIMC